MNKQQIIKNTAQKVRTELELCQRREKLWTKGLRGACATASFLLQEYLKTEGINSEVVYAQRKRWGVGHVWVETEDFIIDVTYTQFKAGFPIVIVDKKDIADFKAYYEGVKESTIKKNVEACFFYWWPSNQNPEFCIPILKGLM